MEKNKQAEPTKESRGIDRISRWLVYIDDIILVLVAAGIIGVAVALVIEAASVFIYSPQPSIPHIISALMFALIIRELFRQVLRQLPRHTFSLNPFLFIGIIASIR